MLRLCRNAAAGRESKGADLSRSRGRGCRADRRRREAAVPHRVDRLDSLLDRRVAREKRQEAARAAVDSEGLDLLRQLALELDLVPAHYRGDLVRQISEAIVRLNQSKKQHPILICDEAQLLPHAALEQLPLLLNFDMDSAHYLTLLLVGQPLLRRTLSLQMHEPLRQRIAVQYHLDGLSREELDGYLAQQLKAAGVGQPLFDDTARQALYQATKGILRKVNKLALTALRLAAGRKLQAVNEAILLDATSEALL